MIKNRILEGIAHIACTRYRLVLLISILLTVLSLLPPSFIGMHFAFDISKMLPQEIPSARAFTRAVIDFDSADEAVIVFHLDGTAQELAIAGRIADRIAARLGKDPKIKSAFCRKFDQGEVEYLRDVELPRRGLLLLDMPHLQQVQAKLTPRAIRRSVRRTRKRLLSSMAGNARAEKLIVQDVLGLYSIFGNWLKAQGLGSGADKGPSYIVDKNRRMLLLVAQPTEPAQSVSFSRDVMEVVRRITREELEQEPPRVQQIFPLDDRKGIEFGGGYEIACRYKSRVNQTLITTLVTSMIGVILLFGFCFRRYGVLLYVGLPLVMVVSWTVGVGWIIFGQLNIVSCAFAAVLVGLGVDYAIHIYNRYVEERAGGHSVEESFRASLAHTGWGVFIGMMTTSLAFLALKATRFTQLSQFGILAGLGIALSVPGMLFVLPALIAWRNARKEEHHRILQPTTFFLPQLAEFVDQHRKIVLVTGFILIAACSIELVLRRDQDLRFDQRMSTLRPGERAFTLGGDIARTFSSRNPNKLMLLAYGNTEEEAMNRAAVQLDGCKRMLNDGLILAYKSVLTYLPAPSKQRQRLELLRHIDFPAALENFRKALDRAGLEHEPFKENINLLEQHAELVRTGRIILPSDFVGTPVERWVKRLVTRRRKRYDIRHDIIPQNEFPLTLAKPVVMRTKTKTTLLHAAGEKLTPAQVEQLHGKVKRITLLSTGWTVKTNVYPPIMPGEENRTADLNITETWIRQAREYLHLDPPGTPDSELNSFLTGTGMLAHELAGVVKDDFWHVSLWVLGVATIVLIFFFHRHPARVVYCLFPIITGLLFLFGIMSFATLLAPGIRALLGFIGIKSSFNGINFNFINVLAIPIVIGLGVDNGIHLVSRFYEAGRRIRPVIGDTGRAIMITTLTSMIGFGSLAVGGYQGITSMGVLSILALGSNLLASLVFFPAVLGTFSPPESIPDDPEMDQD